MNAKDLCQELVALIDDQMPVDELYPLLRQLGEKLPASLADSFSMRLDKQSQNFVIETKYPNLDETKYPSLDQRHFARWDVMASLSDADDTEIRDHIRKVVRAILREMERTDQPTITTDEACKILGGIHRSTLTRQAGNAGIKSVSRGLWLKSDIESLR